MELAHGVPMYTHSISLPCPALVSAKLFFIMSQPFSRTTNSRWLQKCCLTRIAITLLLTHMRLPDENVETTWAFLCDCEKELYARLSQVCYFLYFCLNICGIIYFYFFIFKCRHDQHTYTSYSQML